MFFYLNLIFGYRLVISIYFYLVHGEIKLTYLIKMKKNLKKKNFFQICEPHITQIAKLKAKKKLSIEILASQNRNEM